ncbi:PREDICTED: uncharacterized protein LOC108610646 [Drosophila arizonae]|uniref:Uncharacterized protein LOC108610646 n=1 Tax=Drosophila arizonae TaxID=7263 RepID=A0ABM1NTQ8_DROAR|nr:PREDICTED: uncharacterized protein LOC108610646 [Drosophila arizonae]
MVKTKLLSLLLLLIALPQRMEANDTNEVTTTMKNLDNSTEAAPTASSNTETTVKDIANSTEAAPTASKHPETTETNMGNVTGGSSTVAKIPQTTMKGTSKGSPAVTKIPPHLGVTSDPNQTSTDLIDLITYQAPEEAHLENGGHQISLPGKNKNQGIRHVHAHDGFHNIKREPLWAHWNDVFESKKATAQNT